MTFEQFIATRRSVVLAKATAAEKADLEDIWMLATEHPSATVHVYDNRFVIIELAADLFITIDNDDDEWHAKTLRAAENGIYSDYIDFAERTA